MDNTKLYLCMGKNRLYRFRKTFQPINTGNKDIFEASVSQLCNNFQPELGSLFLVDPDAQNVLETIQAGPREIRTSWVPPRSVSHWGIGVPLETVRFAAVNHLCVDLTYLKRGNELKRYRIEPYSLYKTQDDNLIIRAVRADIGEPRSFRVDRIRSISATDVSFRPRYTIEMYKHGPVMSQASSTRSYRDSHRTIRTTPRPRRTSLFNRQRSNGTKYVYECTYCGKKFTHSSQNSQLRPHKDKSGWDCREGMAILLKPNMAGN
jgi:hypothetical protein